MNREQIITTLVAQLDDTFLKRVFPETDPAEVRTILGKNENKPSAEKKSSATNKQPIQTASLAELHCRLYTDGASRGNPGKAGAGAVLLDQQNQELATCSKYLGTCTNNVAEYKALILGIDKALNLGCRKLAIHLDSELIVRQIEGRYKVKNEGLKPLFTQVKGLLSSLSHWTITHVPRAKNARADQLANKGIDNKI